MNKAIPIRPNVCESLLDCSCYVCIDKVAQVDHEVTSWQRFAIFTISWISFLWLKMSNFDILYHLTLDCTRVVANENIHERDLNECYSVVYMSGQVDHSNEQKLKIFILMSQVWGNISNLSKITSKH